MLGVRPATYNRRWEENNSQIPWSGSLVVPPHIPVVSQMTASSLSHPASPAASADTPTTDPYLWVGPASGLWREGANWQDQTTSTTGTFPTLHNAVQFGVDTPE